MLGTWWVSPFWSLACSHSLSAALLPLFQYLGISLLMSLFHSHDGGLAFLCGARSVRAAVFSLTCLSCPRSFVFLGTSFLQGAIATIFVSLLTPCH